MNIRPRVGAAVGAVVVIASVTLAGFSSAAPGHRQAGAADRKSTLYVDIDSGKSADPTNFNPYGPNTTNDGGLSQVLYEPLFVPNLLNGTQIPWLAVSMTPSANFKVWTLTLRKGILWNDGKPFTSDDVVFTIQMIQKHPDLNTPNKYPGLVAKAVSPTVVRMTLAKADPRLQLAGFSSVLPSKELYIVPKHIFASAKDPVKFTNYDPAKGWPVATGPYKLASETPTSFTYTRDDNWWGKKVGFMSLPAPKTVVYEALGPQDTRAAAMAQNDLDVGAGFSVGALQTLTVRNKKVQAWSTSPPYGFVDICPRSLDFQTQTAPWDNPQLRWAVNYAINRRALINVAYQGASQGSTSMLPAFPALTPYIKKLASSGVFKQYPISTTNVAKAKQLIESQGYTMSGGTYQKGGQQLSLEISTFEDPTMIALASTIAEQLKQIGIAATAKHSTIPNFIDALLGGKFQANVFFGACGSTIDPWQSLDAFNVSHYVPADKSTAGFYANTFRWDTTGAKAYSAIVDKIGQLAPGDPKLVPLFVQAMKLFYAELPSIPLAQVYLLNPVNSTYWTNWATATNPYIDAAFASPVAHVIFHKIQPAK
jgi:peptide/nickel transport system substrate-binding protein